MKNAPGNHLGVVGVGIEMAITYSTQYRRAMMNLVSLTVWIGREGCFPPVLSKKAHWLHSGLVSRDTVLEQDGTKGNYRQ